MIPGILMAVLCAVSILVPCLTMFHFADYFRCGMRVPAFSEEWVEILLLAGIGGAAVFHLKKMPFKAAALLFLAACFTYYHVNFLPMLAAGAYLLVLLLTGDFVTGAGIVITAECLLSLFGIGSIRNLRVFVLLLTAAVIALAIKSRAEWKKRWEAFIAYETTPLENAVILTVFLTVMVQAGRMNGALDFDSLWYGLRSDRVLAPGSGIYENLGLLGMVYTYPKGFEVLTLILSGLRSYSYVIAVNTWLFVYGLYLVYRLTELFCGRKMGLIAVITTCCIPGIANMCVSAKPDMITWVLQILMLLSFFAFVKEEGSFHEVIPPFLLSLTMKPTSFVFSTALFGMMCIAALLYRKKRKENFGFSRELIVTSSLSFIAFCGITGRTLTLTGLPVTSVFSGLLTKLGFSVKYPFSVTELPENYQDASAVSVLWDRLCHMLLSPMGDDMNHVIIAWGGGIFFTAIALVLLTGITRLVQKNPGRREHERALRARELMLPALLIFLPFLVTGCVAISMLYQVDGNYFMTFYSVLLLMFFCALSEKPWRRLRDNRWIFLIPVLLFQFFLMTVTNWASYNGFTEFALNRGSYNHRAYDREYFLGKVSGDIWDRLEEEPEARVIAFADHPGCLRLPAVTQSFDDTFDTWGNPEVVLTPENYEEYIRFAGVDYIYVEPEFFEPSWHESAKRIFDDFTDRGMLKEVAGTGAKLYEVVSASKGE